MRREARSVDRAAAPVLRRLCAARGRRPPELLAEGRPAVVPDPRPDARSAYSRLSCGSGAETIAHARENGPRSSLMFCAFTGPPRIVRLHGRVRKCCVSRTMRSPARFELPEHPVRSVIRVDVERIADSCGYGVPLHALRRQAHAVRRVDRQEAARRRTRRVRRREELALSIDGLPRELEQRGQIPAGVSTPASAARRLDPHDVARPQLPRHLRRLLLAVDERAPGRAVLAAARAARRMARGAPRAPRAGSPRARAARGRRRRRRGARPRRREPSRSCQRSTRSGYDSSSASTGVISVFDIATCTPDGPSASAHAPWPPPIVS